MQLTLRLEVADSVQNDLQNQSQNPKITGTEHLLITLTTMVLVWFELRVFYDELMGYAIPEKSNTMTMSGFDVCIYLFPVLF